MNPVLEKDLLKTGQKLQIKMVRRAAIYAFFSANMISFVGNVLTAIAIPWFVLQTTGSYVLMGITAFVSALPSILSSIFSSVIVDRLGYKRTSVIGDIASGVSVALVPLLYHSIGLAFWQLLVLVFLGGLLKAPGSVARESLVPDLAELAEMGLERANAASDGLSRISGFIGAPLAGVLITLIGTSNLLWFDAASFLLSALLIGCAVPFSPPVQQKREQQNGRYLLDIREGLRFLSQQQVILALVATVVITNLLDAAHSAVLMPAYVKLVFGSPVPMGIMFASFGGAAFLGTVIFGAIGHRLPRRFTFGLCFMVLGVRFWMLTLPLSLPILIVIQLLSGLAAGPLNPIISTIQQRLIPSEMRARIFGLVGAGYMAGVPLGGLMGGLLVTWIGLMPTALCMGICYLLATGSLLVNPHLKSIDVRETM